MKYLIYLTLPCLVIAQTSFITPMEYASQLYKNPRGIGCQHCHGDAGEGKLIANFIDKKKKKSFRGPAINELGFEKFYKSLNTIKRGMPRYFLTKKEVQALYLYLHRDELKKKKENTQKKEDAAIAK